MPKEECTWLVDLNKDGKQDILMHHPSTTEPHQVTVLIARGRLCRHVRHSAPGSPQPALKPWAACAEFLLGRP